MSIHHDRLEREYEQEYTTRVFVFTTQFKDRYVPVNGFSPHGFKGTQKEYDEATAIYYKSHDNGKIIGTFKHTLEEWEKKIT